MATIDRTGEPLLRVEDLQTYFYTRTGVVKAVDGITFDLHPGETLGIVGESGSGKSMTAWSILGLVPQPAGKIVGGKIIFKGQNLLEASEAEMRAIRGSGISMVMQDPLTSLNPVFTIGSQVIESLRMENKGSMAKLKTMAAELLAKVSIPSPETRLTAYPHEMSGGMRQRVVGAIAISRFPSVLIADEPTTSLDATVQLQYLKLLKEIQENTGAAIIFITHDLGIVANMCDRVGVMYAGKFVEQAPVQPLFDNPAHPYTEALMRSVPDLEVDVDHLPSIDGQPPSPDDLPPGCAFAPRCEHAFDKCEVYPDIFKIGENHTAACWRHSGEYASNN
jgi:oligopeptide/dipeptide ABC transporter ATP-binding protein